MKTKTLILTFSMSVLIGAYGYGQTIYTITTGGEMMIKALDRMVNEQTLPGLVTNGPYNNTTSNPINVTSTYTWGAFAPTYLTSTVAYEDIPIETWRGSTTATGACATSVAGLSHMTMTFGKQTAQSSAPAHEYGKLLWSEDPATVPGTCNSTPHSCGAYYNHFAQSQYLNPMNAVGHHNHVSYQACGRHLRNHNYKVWLIDAGGNAIHFSQIKDIKDDWYLDVNSSTMPTTCITPPSISSDPPIANQIPQFSNAQTGYSNVLLPSGIRLNVELLNGTLKEVFLFANGDALIWKHKYDPCTPNDDLDCKYISTMFNPGNPTDFHVEGPDKSMLQSISINPIQYDWNLPGLSLSTRVNHTSHSSAAMGMQPIELNMHYVKYSDFCYHTSSVTNMIYFPGNSCTMPPPPAANPEDEEGENEDNLGSEEKNSPASSTTNVESVDGMDSGIQLFPNPSSDIVNIQGLQKMNSSITITDLSGKEVKSFEGVVTEDFPVDVSSLNKGIYIINVIQGNTSNSFKMAKE